MPGATEQATVQRPNNPRLNEITNITHSVDRILRKSRIRVDVIRSSRIITGKSNPLAFCVCSACLMLGEKSRITSAQTFSFSRNENSGCLKNRLGLPVSAVSISSSPKVWVMSWLPVSQNGRSPLVSRQRSWNSR